MKPEETLRVVHTDVNREIEDSKKIQREIAMLHLIDTERRNVWICNVSSERFFPLPRSV